MKTTKIITIACLVLLIAAWPAAAGKSKCTTIQSGELLTSSGDVILPGNDAWGYNYQGRKFNGMYCDAYQDASWCQPYREDHLAMKWNDAWLSNKDCDDDGLLDRHYGHTSYIGSGAWLTNHQRGSYEDAGRTCNWNYFVKIVAAPSSAAVTGGVWYNAAGDEIGYVIWGSFAVTQEVWNDPCGGENGLLYKGARPGLGAWQDPNE